MWSLLVWQRLIQCTGRKGGPGATGARSAGAAMPCCTMCHGSAAIAEWSVIVRRQESSGLLHLLCLQGPWSNRGEAPAQGAQPAGPPRALWAAGAMAQPIAAAAAAAVRAASGPSYAAICGHANVLRHSRQLYHQRAASAPLVVC